MVVLTHLLNYVQHVLRQPYASTQATCWCYGHTTKWHHTLCPQRYPHINCFLSSHPVPCLQTLHYLTSNGLVHILCQVIQHVVASATKAELGTLAISECVNHSSHLHHVGWPGLPTSIINNSYMKMGSFLESPIQFGDMVYSSNISFQSTPTLRERGLLIKNCLHSM